MYNNNRKLMRQGEGQCSILAMLCVMKSDKGNYSSTLSTMPWSYTLITI